MLKKNFLILKKKKQQLIEHTTPIATLKRKYNQESWPVIPQSILPHA